MRKFGFTFTLLAALGCGLGCSQETMNKAGDAADAAGEAAASAADDAAAAMNEAAEDISDAVDGDEISEEEDVAE